MFKLFQRTLFFIAILFFPIVVFAQTGNSENLDEYNNFIFSAQDDSTRLWNIWKRKNDGIYAPIFNDKYGRMSVDVSPDKTEMIYVRYISYKNLTNTDQKSWPHTTATMDSIWICRSDIDGGNEKIILLAPNYNRDIITTLDWSADKDKIVFTSLNDQWPKFTRDGDIYMYEISSGKLSNLTNDFDLIEFSVCFAPDDKAILFSKCENPWFGWPINIYRMNLNDKSISQITNASGFSGNDQVSFIQQVINDSTLLYNRQQNFGLYLKRGISPDSLIFEKGVKSAIYMENDLFGLNTLKQGGVQSDSLFHILKKGKIIKTFNIPQVKSLKDDYYYIPNEVSTKFKWLGKFESNIKNDDVIKSDTILCKLDSIVLNVDTTALNKHKNPRTINDLIAYYPFNGNAQDESGNGHHGKVSGAQLTSDRLGIKNTAYSFNGLGDFIDIGKLPLEKFTISAWILTEENNIGAILDNNRDKANNSGYTLIYGNGTGNFNGIYGHIGWSGIEKNTLIPSNKKFIQPGSWNQITFSYENGTGKLYLNGNIIAVKDSMNSVTSNIENTLIGKSVWGGNLFKGKIDDISIFNRALNPDEINYISTPIRIKWSTGDTLPEIKVPPIKAKYKVTITKGNLTIVDSIIVIPGSIKEKPKLNWLGNIFLADTGFINYEWIVDGKPIAAGSSNAFKPTLKGLYQVKVMNNLGCTDTSSSFNLIVTGFNPISNSRNSGFLIYPNPTKNTLNIIKPDITRSSLQYGIYSINGELLKSGTLNRIKNTLNLSEFKKGYYILSIRGTDKINIFNFIKD